MGRKAIDLTGQRFNRLIVLERAENKNNHPAWKCLCECGNEVIVSSNSLKSGHTKSCGCLNTKHGMKGTNIYYIWQSIKQRCLNPNNRSYCNYGGRGITICAEWRDDFQAFYNYVSQLEHFNEKDYSLDRINNNGNYEPGNLHWADKKTQQRNRRSNRIVNYNGVEMCLKDAAELSGINKYTLCNRYEHGDRGERLFRPVRN